ncbi:MAG: N-acyl homoserine lactonase family protein [Clostridiales Family XIII bacterium]|jgi:glyoxylase-like metal-dependent hydrolase (beta-lactamase superfamily II)|nr:N-acyl homoserine lactonase family protein [Clostridiales Family XIII bacterium]
MANMKLYVLENGALRGPKINSRADADPSEMQTAPIFSVLIDHADGLLLLDAGCHTDEKRQHPMIFRDFSMKPEDHIESRLAALGVRPADIRLVVVSHLHADHTGYLELFQNAEFFVHEDEFTQRVKLYALGDASAGSGGDIAFWISEGLRFTLIPADEPEREILPGVRILNFGPGHSFGMLGLLADLPRTGKILLAGDAIYNRENVGPPVRLPGNVCDKDGFVRSVERIVRRARDENALLWYGHDEAQFAGLIKSTEGCYD